MFRLLGYGGAAERAPVGNKSRATVNYKIGNERLVRVTEKAARKLALLLEAEGQAKWRQCRRSLLVR